ncbi:MAG: penicillin-binding protein [Sphingomonadales bacterium 32-68-7]|nr:MAG: penicillin-binding protein [Sphingomonadales bacterium 12-68-11]OYX08221.1 MAG: penicillin-binding protein [Sphingomonadales bacterium 32-68-7]
MASRADTKRSWPWRWRRKAEPTSARADYDDERPYAPLYDDDGPGDPEFGAWLDERLGLRAESEVESPTEAGEPQPKKSRTRWWWISRVIAGVLFVFMLLLAWLAITAPLSKSLRPIAAPEITLLAADGTPIARNGAVVDQPVEVEKLPPHVVEALLAIEDRRFYSHWGIDPKGLARALWSNLTTGRTQGGSTITQQLAKFTFLTSDQNLTRKAREALIAFWLEGWLTKDEILERYLSNAYFGDNVYGLRAASLHYFYRKPENLRLEQAAMLVGMLQAPSRLAPTNNPELAERRMRLVLNAMVAAGYITAAEARAAPTPAVDVRRKQDLPTGTYFADWALPQARQLTEASYSRQTIRTTLDSRLQAAARRAVERAAIGGAQVALVAMRTNGEVVAMIGGKDYGASPFNRATQARRQPGSTFKLFVYLAALDAGMSPDDAINNLPFEQGSYRPRNSGGTYSEEITLADAFAQSSNVAAVRLWQQVGDGAVIARARDFGITSPLASGDPSLALGTSNVTLLELTAAYAGVAANLYPVEPTAFASVEPGWLGSWFDGRSSLPRGEHEAIEAMLRQAVNRGTGRAAMLSVPNFGKTGTTQDNRDALFVGYAGELVVGVWIGNDDNTPLAGVSGGGLPARIWKDFMSQALGERAAPARPAPTESPDPEGPIQPLDVPEIGDIPIGNDARLRIGEGGVGISGEIRGAPIDVRIDRNGVRIDSEPRNRERAPAGEGQP